MSTLKTVQKGSSIPKYIPQPAFEKEYRPDMGAIRSQMKPGRLKVYVAGPINPRKAETGHDAARLMYKQIQAGIDAGVEIIKKGHIPFIPHLDYYVHLSSEWTIPAPFWYTYDYYWIDHCDAVYRMPGDSPGADAEVAWAKEHGLRVYYNLQSIPEGPTW